MGSSSRSQTRRLRSDASCGALKRHPLHLAILQTLLFSLLLCQRHLAVEGCSVNLIQLCPIIPEDVTQEPSVLITFEVTPAECEVEEFLINIVGSDGRSRVISRAGILGETQYEELILWEQLPDTRGSYTFSVQVLGLDGNSSRTSSAKVVISYVYGCQKRFEESSPALCNILCRFACETPQLQFYSLTASDSQGLQETASSHISQPVLLPCDLDIVTIETQGLDVDRNVLNLPNVIGGPRSTPTSSSTTGGTDPTSSSTSSSTTTSPMQNSTTAIPATTSSDTENNSTENQATELTAGLSQATLVIIILGSLLAGMVVLFLLAATIVCLWLVTKKKVLICKNKRGESTSARQVLQTPPLRNTYYDSVRHNSSRSTSAVYDTVRRGNGPEIFITRSQETLRDASEHSSLRPLQVSPNNTYESPYDITTRPTDLQAPAEGDPALSDTRVASPYYSYAYNGRKVELDQLREGENGWLAIVRGGRRLVKSWTGSEHVYI